MSGQEIGFGLGDRMKRYEAVQDATLMRRVPAVVRVVGKAFHSLTRGMDRPFDALFVECMATAAVALMEDVQGAKLAYVQSDEISVILSDYDTLQTEAWFGYRVQKMASVAASIATAAFGAAFRGRFPDRDRVPLFDARVFSLPDEDEVVNYLVWRQQDAVRNSILGTAQAHFSPKQMHGQNTSVLQDMLFSDKGINWNDTPTHLKRGLCVLRSTYQEGEATRHRIAADWEIPTFTKDREYVLSRLPGGSLFAALGQPNRRTK